MTRRRVYEHVRYLPILLLALLPASVYAQVEQPTTVIQRYYCVAGDQPASPDGWFRVGTVDVSAQPFDLWCEAVY